jgi:hypothetical protein
MASRQPTSQAAGPPDPNPNPNPNIEYDIVVNDFGALVTATLPAR